MKNKIMNLNRITISLLIIVSILLNSPVYAGEIQLNSGEIIPISYLDNNRFEITNNIYSDGRLLFSKGTVGGKNVGHIADVNGNYHSFFVTQDSVKESSPRLGENGPKVLPLVGAVAATALAVPVSAFLVVVDCSSGSGVNCGGVGLLPFIPAAFLAKKAFEEDE